jgi:hypothetical protein
VDGSERVLEEDRLIQAVKAGHGLDMLVTLTGDVQPQKSLTGCALASQRLPRMGGHGVAWGHPPIESGRRTRERSEDASPTPGALPSSACRLPVGTPSLRRPVVSPTRFEPVFGHGRVTDVAPRSFGYTTNVP